MAAMNDRAKELGMINTTFVNCYGLDDAGHLTTARDISIMSLELLKHEWITVYTSTWVESLRDGAFTIANTNKLLKSYTGANGLKTGSTALAKYWLATPVEAGQTVGEIYYMVDGIEIARSRLTAATAIGKRRLFAQFNYYLRQLLKS